MKYCFSFALALLVAILVAFPVFASSDANASESVEMNSSVPGEEQSVFGAIGDDFFDDGDFVAFDDESLSNSSEIFRNSIGSITNVALYGLLVLIGIFALFEIVRSIAA